MRDKVDLKIIKSRLYGYGMPKGLVDQIISELEVRIHLNSLRGKGAVYAIDELGGVDEIAKSYAKMFGYIKREYTQATDNIPLNQKNKVKSLNKKAKISSNGQNNSSIKKFFDDIKREVQEEMLKDEEETENKKKINVKAKVNNSSRDFGGYGEGQIFNPNTEEKPKGKISIVAIFWLLLILYNIFKFIFGGE